MAEFNRHVKNARTLVALATYNERENLARLLDAIFLAMKDLEQLDVLVVDDQSPDGTGDIADAYAQRDARVHVMHRRGKLGLGSAVLDALQFASAYRYEFIILLDADFSHPPERIPDLLRGMTDFDVMIGSRYVHGGGIEGWGWRRWLMSRAINTFSRWILGLKARDCSGNFRCLRVAKVERIQPGWIRSRGYSFMEEFLLLCQQTGCRIGETPIRFVNRKNGKSNLHLREMLRSIWILCIIAVTPLPVEHRPVTRAFPTNDMPPRARAG